MDDVKLKTTSCRVGVDVGGTFTDLVLADSRTGDLTFFKAPSVPDDPAKSFQRELEWAECTRAIRWQICPGRFRTIYDLSRAR